MDWVREEEGLVPPRPGNQLQGGMDERRLFVSLFVRLLLVSSAGILISGTDRDGRMHRAE